MKVIISGTFTVEPIHQPFLFLSELIFPTQLEFAPYNQVLQQLIDQNSLFSQNLSGINIILFRLEDWLRYDNSIKPDVDTSELAYKISKCAENFINAIYSYQKRNHAPCFILCLHPSLRIKEKIEVHEKYLEIEKTIQEKLTDLSGIIYLSTSELQRLYPVQDYYSPTKDYMGHIPFTDTMYSAIALYLLRQIHALYNPYKLIILDCDNTLWGGECGDLGPLGIKISPPFQILQQFMHQQTQKGFLICLCSKNNEEDVWRVFEKNESMKLKKIDVVLSKINFDKKSENIRSIAEALQLGLDSALFFDDNPLETAEVQLHCPQVLAFTLPNNPDNIPHFLDHLWVFDRIQITEEDRKRTLYYQQDVERKKFQQSTMSLEEFIQGLQTKIEMSRITQNEYARAAQLTVRTNQFNASTIRRNEQEIQQFCSQVDHEGYIITAKDQFGDFGVIGLLLLFTNNNHLVSDCKNRCADLRPDLPVEQSVEHDSNLHQVVEGEHKAQRDKDGPKMPTDFCNQTLVVDTMLLSCRVIGRGIEHQIMANLGKIANQKKCASICIIFQKTSRNQLIEQFLNSIHPSRIEKNGDKHFFYFQSDEAEKISITTPPQNSREPPPFNAQTSNQITTEKHLADANTKSSIYSKLATLYSDPQKVSEQVTRKRDFSHLAIHVDELLTKTATKRQEIIRNLLLKILRLFLPFDLIENNKNFMLLGLDSLATIEMHEILQKIFEKYSLSYTALYDYPSIDSLTNYIESIISEGEKYKAKSTPHPNRLFDRKEYSIWQALPLNLEIFWLSKKYIAPHTLGNIITIKSKIDVDVLAQSVNAVVEMNPIFFTKFSSFSPHYKILPFSSVKIKIIDLRSSQIEEQELKKKCLEFINSEFPLHLLPRIQFMLFQIRDDFYQLCYRIHHFIGDFYSLWLIGEQIVNSYHSFMNGLQTIKYKDYWDANETLEMLYNKNVEENIEVLNKSINDNFFSFNIKCKNIYSKSFLRKKYEEFVIPKSRMNELRDACLRNNFYYIDVLHALFSLSAGVILDQKKFSTYNILNSRYDVDTIKTIGPLINLIPYQYSWKEDQSLIEFIKFAEAAQKQAKTLKQYPIELNLRTDITKKRYFILRLLLKLYFSCILPKRQNKQLYVKQYSNLALCSLRRTFDPMLKNTLVMIINHFVTPHAATDNLGITQDISACVQAIYENKKYNPNVTNFNVIFFTNAHGELSTVIKSCLSKETELEIWDKFNELIHAFSSSSESKLRDFLPAG